MLGELQVIYLFSFIYVQVTYDRMLTEDKKSVFTESY